MVSLGARPMGANHDPAVCSKGTRIILDVASELVEECKPKRLMVVSSLGVGESWDDCGFILKGFIKVFLGRPIADKEIQEKMVKEGPFPWTILRPGGLTDAKITAPIRLDEHLGGGGRVSRQQVAAAMLTECVEGKWIGKAPTIIT